MRASLLRKDRWSRPWLAAAAAVSLAFLPALAHAEGGIIRDAEIEATLLGYERPLAQAAGLNPDDVKVFILQDKSLNAFVAGGQNIFLHTGLILESKSPNQLKGVMAHETGHIAGGHLARSREAMAAAARPAFIAIGLGILAIAAGAPEAGAALIGGSGQFAMADYVRHSQVQESSADQAGVSFLETSRQSPEGLMSFLEKFRYEEVMSDARRSPYFRTHPLSADRIESMRKRVDASAYRNAAENPEDLRRFQMMQAKLIGFIEPAARTYQVYPLKDTSAPARYARAIAACGCGVAGRSPDVARAQRELTFLLQDDPNNPYFHELMGQVLFENARAKDSVAHYREAYKRLPDNALMKINLARALSAANGKAGATEAIELLNGAVRAEPDNPFAWKVLAEAYDQIGDEGRALLASAEQNYAIGDYRTAVNFAERARRALPQDSPANRRASDISAASKAAMPKRRGPG